MSLFRRRERPPRSPEWVKVAFARHQPEAEMLAGLLRELEIPVLIRRAGLDVPDMLAGGPRELLVPAAREARGARPPGPDGAARVGPGTPAAACAMIRT